MNDTTVKDKTVNETTVNETTAHETIAAEPDAQSRAAEQEQAAEQERAAEVADSGVIDTVLHDDRGMSTIEYALGCVAAAALGALLYLVVTSDTVESALSGIFERALNTQ